MELVLGSVSDGVHGEEREAKAEVRLEVRLKGSLGLLQMHLLQMECLVDGV